ncbi:hypothetical protein [Marilutibacter chinensis]|uniref:Lipase (Class 3) n=1 Tax=Marilutibacter chinensis TaxID=2912247 RepID=A0ABS9HTW3_9GAMM|nr:hypothetical protein [Lysobacter chinensis]
MLDFVDNPDNGYQGTIYQRMDSGELIVAHRGTEFERERWQDLIKTDGAMVVGRTNLQADDALALAKRARELAGDPMVAGPYGDKLEVTTTGHSLGGTLAQITAHHYDLCGETFNAYGAVSLSYRIPEGGDRMINHVTAADMVSSGSRHYGQVRVYAMPQEIEMLRDRGYANNDSRLLDPRNMLGAAIDGIGSHDMHYFRNVDGDGRPDRSVLSDPRTQALARSHAPMIEKYREDVEGMRQGLANVLRGPGGVLQDGIDRLRGPVEAGEPAAREAREQADREAREAARARPYRGGSGLFDPDGPLKWPDSLPRGEMGGPPLRAGADAGARLDRLLAGGIDPARQQEWDRELAVHRQRTDPAQEQDVLQQRNQQQTAEPAGMAR